MKPTIESPAGDERLDKTDYETLAEFRYALRQFLHFSEDAALAEGLTPQQHQALLAIKGYPRRDEVTIRELATRLQIKHHSAVGLVDRHVEKRWLRRGKSNEDLRCVMLTLTPRAEEVLELLSRAHRNELISMSPVLRRLLRILK